MAPQLFWIGLGNMGRGMSKNLAEKGSLDKPLLVYNRTKKRADDLVAKVGSDKAEALDSIEDGVKRSSIIFTSLSNDQAVEELYASILKSGSLEGKLFVETSTIHPDTTERVAKSLIDAGAEFVASPVFGAPAAADAAQLIFVPAGPKSSIDKLRPFIQGVMGKAEIPFEDKAYGTALKLKLIGNTFVLNMVTQLAEALTLAEKSEVGTAPVKQFVDLFVGGPWSAYGERMIGGVYHKMDAPLFSADNAVKDASHALDLGQSNGVELKNAQVAKEYAQDVAKHAGGDKGDIAGIYGAVRLRAGLKYENDA
ncbi:6-phosphogluconate dehydrogenase [Apiospora saccharicola]|uniref:6-phosphogluconate dehydrogenase n=1 Tax=Apiospora saccharicola TaxID=335842 RepID=A0ABR1UL50_9PEZI